MQDDVNKNLKKQDKRNTFIKTLDSRLLDPDFIKVMLTVYMETKGKLEKYGSVMGTMKEESN